MSIPLSAQLLALGLAGPYNYLVQTIAAGIWMSAMENVAQIENILQEIDRLIAEFLSDCAGRMV